MRDSLDSLYIAYFSDIYRFLFSLCHNHHTAEDLVQETFFRAHLHIEDYQKESVKAWLFKVAYHSYIDHYRKQKRVTIKDRGYFSGFLDNRKAIDEAVVAKEEIEELLRKVNALPEKYKMAVLLCDFNDLSYQEAADVMKVSNAYIKVLLYRGRQAIRQGRGNENG
ncbi:sigma-70 family RNA polymerase sigma factor [Bacillus sp. 1P06AnD]|uniref:sigma-70 family RNA polymerase sigma factor n=1 Tax=Bacillus sp. 1P06AnD TaxID=3132208 RepID=UPI0039A08670